MVDRRRGDDRLSLEARASVGPLVEARPVRKALWYP